MDASEIYSKRLNAKEVIFPKQREFIFPIADGRIRTPGGDQELRTSTLIRPRPIQGEGHVDFLGESEGSLPQPHDSHRENRTGKCRGIQRRAHGQRASYDVGSGIATRDYRH